MNKDPEPQFFNIKAMKRAKKEIRELRDEIKYPGKDGTPKQWYNYLTVVEEDCMDRYQAGPQKPDGNERETIAGYNMRRYKFRADVMAFVKIVRKAKEHYADLMFAEQARKNRYEH